MSWGDRLADSLGDVAHTQCFCSPIYGITVFLYFHDATLMPHIEHNHTIADTQHLHAVDIVNISRVCGNFWIDDGRNVHNHCVACMVVLIVAERCGRCAAVRSINGWAEVYLYPRFSIPSHRFIPADSGYDWRYRREQPFRFHQGLRGGSQKNFALIYLSRKDG